MRACAMRRHPHRLWIAGQNPNLRAHRYTALRVLLSSVTLPDYQMAQILTAGIQEVIGIADGSSASLEALDSE